MNRWGLAAIALAACGAPSSRAPAAPPMQTGRAATSPATTPAATAPAPAEASPEAQQEARLAAIQNAMNELDEAAQQCWAFAATERFDIAGELALQIDIAAAAGVPARVTIVRDTARAPKLATCVTQGLAAYRWAPPLAGQSIQLPFKFRAVDGQNTIDRAIVEWRGQAHVAVAVLLDEANTGNARAAMFELAIGGGHDTGLRWADRAELWYFLGEGEVRGASGAPQRFAAGDMMYVPAGAARNVAAGARGLHAMIAVVPGGREGAARGGALPTRDAANDARARSAPQPQLLPAAKAITAGPATIYADATTVRGAALAASVLAMPVGGQVAEHAHARETELLYVLDGAGTMTVGGVALPVSATSVVQVPPGVKHAFTASKAFRAVQVYVPGGPEQRFKAKR